MAGRKIKKGSRTAQTITAVLTPAELVIFNASNYSVISALSSSTA